MHAPRTTEINWVGGESRGVWNKTNSWYEEQVFKMKYEMWSENIFVFFCLFVYLFFSV